MIPVFLSCYSRFRKSKNISKNHMPFFFLLPNFNEVTFQSQAGPRAPCICVVAALIHSTAKWRLWLFEVNSKTSPCFLILLLALPIHAALLALYQFNLCFVRSLCQVIVLQYGKIEEFFTMYSNVTTITGTLLKKKVFMHTCKWLYCLTVKSPTMSIYWEQFSERDISR